VKVERQQMERLNRELSQARQIQLNWLPTQPYSFKSIEIAALNKPASHVSGDFYNWFELPDGRIAIVIGDVTGHGMAAAFLMATTQFLIRAFTQRVPDPGRVLAETNRQLSTMVFSGQFVTTLLMVLDVERRELLFSNAGHFPPLIHEDGKFRIPESDSDLVLGVDTTQEYKTYRTTLKPSANLLLYTDGVIEAEALNGDRLSTQGLVDRMNGVIANPAEMVKKVVDIVNDFSNGVDPSDDLTLVAIKINS
jgi:sigma-B regulation protein RsbU (phosphoserine phosphatase)